VVQVIDESNGEVVYTLRIQGDSFRPKVFRSGAYTIKVGEGENRDTLTGVQSLAADQETTLKVSL
jgi:hypothetical protein